MVSSLNPNMGHWTRGTAVLLKALFAAGWCNQVAGWLVGYLWGTGEVYRGELGANSTSQQPATGVPRYRAKICVCTLPGLPRGVFWPDHRVSTCVDLCVKIPEATSGTPQVRSNNAIRNPITSPIRYYVGSSLLAHTPILPAVSSRGPIGPSKTSRLSDTGPGTAVACKYAGPKSS